MQLPPYVRLGLLRDGLGARITPGTGAQPTIIGLDGQRALVRYEFAREAAGSAWDAQAKDHIYRLDEALSAPWVTHREDVLRYLAVADLNLRIDAVLVNQLEDQAKRARAIFPRWIEDESGWKKREGTIDPVHATEVRAAIKELNWKNYGALRPEYSDPGANKGNSLFKFAMDSVVDCGTKQDSLLAWDGGSGKTVGGLVLSDYHQSALGNKSPTIILGLKRHLKQTWIDDEMPQLELFKKRYGADVYWETWLESKDKPKFDAPFILLSLERLQRLDTNQMAHLKKIAKESSIIIDEIYLVGNHQIDRVKALFEVEGKNHIGLSGSPLRGKIENALTVFSWVFRAGSVAFPDYNIKRQGGRKRFAEDFVTWCFTGDTPVMLSDGRFSDIQNIQPGDEVMSYNLIQQEAEIDTVEKLVVSPLGDRVLIQMNIQLDSGKIISIQCTDDHKFLTQNRGWVAARDLHELDDLVEVTEWQS